MKKLALTACLLALVCAASAQSTTPPPHLRARDLGVPFNGRPGPLNAITDVKGVEVGHTTLISGEGPLKIGQGPVRTGVTAVLPRGNNSIDPVFAAWFSLNGNGEMTGTHWIEESGFLEGPVLITNTHSVGVVRDAAIAWRQRRFPKNVDAWSLPVVAETWDGWLNDINGFHVKPDHVYNALDNAHGGPVVEGSVGGGTGMVCNEFKGGIGTASRKLDDKQGGYTIGVLVQCNYGRRENLTIAGVPVGREIPGSVYPREQGSIIIVVATDAPLIPTQLKRVVKRATLGLARDGSIAGNSSGDLFIAFSTANPEAQTAEKPARVVMMSNNRMDPIFQATVEATEEAIVNALVVNETMTGIDNHKVEALPHDKLRQILGKYNRLIGPAPAAPQTSQPEAQPPAQQQTAPQQAPATTPPGQTPAATPPPGQQPPSKP
jgi:D-aminopeptidase